MCKTEEPLRFYASMYSFGSVRIALSAPATKRKARRLGELETIAKGQVRIASLRTMALLILLTAAAGTWIVAPDLVTGTTHLFDVLKFP